MAYMVVTEKSSHVYKAALFLTLNLSLTLSHDDGQDKPLDLDIDDQHIAYHLFNVIQCLERGGLIHPSNLLFNIQCLYSIISVFQFGVLFFYQS